ncbi:MAG: ACT domain-containing protein, partial [Bacteroidota bacterium]
GHVKTLPQGATALDFAYEIHTEIGNKAIGAKINHSLAPLNSKLKSGDQVEIITSGKQKVKRERLDYAITAKAKSAVKAALKAETKNRIETGKKILDEKLKELKVQPNGRVFKKILPAYDANNKDELYSKIGSGMVNLEDLKKVLRKNTRKKWIRYWELSLGKTGKTVKNRGKESWKQNDKKTFIVHEQVNDDESNYLLAKCCNPIPGDEVVGYINEDAVVVIHKSGCENAVKLMSSEGNKIIPIQWTTHKLLSHLVRIHIDGYDRFGVYNNITTVISKELNVDMRTINLHGHDGVFEGNIDLYVHNINDLNNLIMNLMKIKGVEKVFRQETTDSLEA